MSDNSELTQHALNLAENAKDAMRSNASEPPDDVTWEIAVDVLKKAQQTLPNNSLVQKLTLPSKVWSSLRSAMDVVANALKTADKEERHAAQLARNSREKAGVWS